MALFQVTIGDVQTSNHSQAELTVKAAGLGLFLAFVFGAANAYLGMRAGQTVAATIPAAVIALALFRLPSFRGGVKEQNIARTAASVGEALVAGAIFTLPAFLLVELDGKRLWPDLRAHYWEATLILVTGGLLGVFFIIALRRPLCVDAGLPWPESVASAEIVKAGAQAGSAPRRIFAAMGLGALIQVLKSDKGFQIFREYSEGFWALAPSRIRHFNFRREEIGVVTHAGGIAWSTPSLSPALIGIGYIIGFEPASVNFAGGVLAWWVLIPLLLFFDPDLGKRLGGGENAAPELLAYTVWYNVVRPLAVGAMLVAAARTMWSIRHSLVESFRGALAASRRGSAGGVKDPTEQDLPMKWVLLGSLALMIPVIWIYQRFTGNLAAAVVVAVVMALAGFLLSACGGYLVGLVGSSNQPLSGLTLSALILSAMVILGLGMRQAAGVAAALGVASVVACACSVSGSLIQDLKAGQLLGGTPWKMQIVEIVAVVLLSFFLMGPVVALHEANLETGGIGGRALPAPQAGLMAQLAKGILGGQMAWGLLAMGAAFATALILSGTRAPMLIAVGMYLPFDTTAAIFVGGLFKRWVERRAAKRSAAERQVIEERGTLLASGLVSGEAIAGILLATTYLAGIPSLTKVLTGVETVPFFASWGGWLSVAGFGLVGWVLVGAPLRAKIH
ncbi:MAG: oligopeptide transporter, OPT family [Bryobacteraceae bacterium]|nr:oligopeptide transporter, OPT family [Bryobacteraceae bacterium]MDW8378160.1 oligopeptide transporter, OPT family [Bryobacterales bacterium]